MGLNELYRDIILKHARDPKNTGALEKPDLEAEAVNRLCGDALELSLAMDGDRVVQARIRVRGCAIVQASSSMMSEFISDRSLIESRQWGKRFKELLSGRDEAIPDELTPLAPLLELREHRARHQCVLLPWDALSDCAETNLAGQDDT